jgi:hypothetical protein
VIQELNAFIQRRLLTTDTDDTGQGGVVVSVAHEAFLSAWAPLAQAIQDNVSALRARRAIEQAATGWHTQGHLPERLWERGQLAAALADTGTHPRAGQLLTGTSCTPASAETASGEGAPSPSCPCCSSSRCSQRGSP